ncbi:hypothetical protein K5X82_04415 [Halosquirtibacter xylanolyticus]|uniref:hypothetical protein n=1 Tax=Halosquirtibacter xylanolyticus TaxID=3374599 RepID=UPI003749B9B6|nr:hypothetical protein K5X82_04415 [Prolixibacteraceae bacterium]
MKKYILFLAVSLFICMGVSKAQIYADTEMTTSTMSTENLFFIDYTMGFPSGDIVDFVSPTSFRGFSMDFRHMMNDKISLGISAGFQSFYEDFGEMDMTINNGTLHGETYHYLYSVPLYANAHYYFSGGDKMKLFIGCGVGTIYNDRDTVVGGISMSDKAWQFAVAPEVGLLFQANDYMGVQVRGTYDMAFESGDTEAVAYYRLHVGFYYNF